MDSDKLMRRHHQITTMMERCKLKGKHIVIREDLTIENKKLLENVSTLQTGTATWSREGTLRAALTSGKTVRVDRSTALSEIDNIADIRTQSRTL